MMKKVLSILLALVLLTCAGVSMAENVTNSSVNRFNVMLVVDGSNSLVGSEASDPKGLRYDALKLFMGLLTESGNNVGAVVFDDDIILDTGVLEMKSMNSKLSLARKIQDAGTGSYTNIGKAMSVAVDNLEKMSAQNDLPCVILFLSDGNTSMLSAKSEAAARELGDQAIDRAIDDGIVIHGIWLNATGDGNSSEMLQYTKSTGGTFEEVASSENLADAFKRFYTIINNTEYNDADKTYFDENGYAEKTFNVPSFGIEEVNIVLDIKKPVSDIKIQKPDGTILQDMDVENMSIVTSKYQLIKIPSPGPGTWKITLTGKPNDSIDISMLYNYSVTATLSSNNDSENYKHSVPYTFTCTLSDDNAKEVSADSLKTLNPRLIITNSATQETEEIPMDVKDGTFVANHTFKQGTYYLYAVIGAEGFAYKSNQLIANVGNLPPVGDDIVQDVETGLGKTGIFEVNLAEVMTDPEGTDLTFELDSDCDGRATIEDGILKIDCNKAEQVLATVKGTDETGATGQMNITLTEVVVTSKVLIIAAAILVAIIAALIGYKIWRANLRCSLEFAVGLYSDENGWENLDAIYNFRGKKYLSGDVSINPKNYYLEATTNRRVCYFKSKKKIYLDGQRVGKVELREGANVEIALDEEKTAYFTIENC